MIADPPLTLRPAMVMTMEMGMMNEMASNRGWRGGRKCFSMSFPNKGIIHP